MGVKKLVYLPRYIEKNIVDDLKRKMVFVSGPRQAGKTTVARRLCEAAGCDIKKRYMNWDAPDDREKIILETFPAGTGYLALDEIHKYSRWRQVVKGLYDKRGDELDILVTGSARLDYYRRGGDSLQGRYFFYRLFPLTYGEFHSPPSSLLDDLMHYGGFPEPFVIQSEKETRRWSQDYRSRVVREDLTDLENIKDVSLVERLSIRLPALVGSPLSINSLREDLQVSHQSVSRWLIMLENLYFIFRVYPFGAPRIRAVKKEAKHYHSDWTAVREKGPRFENVVACHLLKWTCFIRDTEGRNMELRYFRDVDKREVDFVICEDEKPIHFVECKSRDKKPSRALVYLKQKFPAVKATQVLLSKDIDVKTRDDIRVCSAHLFLSEFV
ncbi:conserved hypothetical protein [Candidatus Desulfarcum epimagneticum]|uniref:AAA family ATPase n=1 Tax=uncultured Desulfobacteraceae bacterium TaxID=218296 RepID=A0A484HN82_9BACT|nr:conserved hypothetical protein [uncultured Desulfobacteraceae bacterium]